MNNTPYVRLILWLLRELQAAIAKGYASPSTSKEWDENIREALKVKQDAERLIQALED